MAFGPLIKGLVFDAINFFPNDPLLPPNPAKPGPEIQAAVAFVVGHDVGPSDNLLGIAPPDVA